MRNPSQSKLKIDRVSRVFASASGAVPALDDVSIAVREGELLCLLGKSGCGKSTLLQIAAGLERPSQGMVYLDSKPVTSPTPKIGMVFQRSSLFPWLTVEQNVRFALDVARSKVPSNGRVKELLALVGLQGFERSRPSQLSGGMAQRVALARTLANRPEVLLLDEPLSALDAFTRMTMQEEIVKIWEKERFTGIFVTHDIEEALFVGTRIVVMTPRPGRIQSIFDVPLARPRDRTSVDFLLLRDRVFAEFGLKRQSGGDYAI